MSNYEWPAFNEGAIVSSTDEVEEIRPPTAEELASMIEDAQRQGFEEGLEQGRQAALEEQTEWVAARQAEFDESLAQLQVQLSETLDKENQALLRSIQWLCRETCQSALLNTLDEPDTLSHLVDALMTKLPKGISSQVYLHPDQAHRFEGCIGDPALGSWGIRIESDDVTLQYDPIDALNEQD